MFQRTGNCFYTSAPTPEGKKELVGFQTGVRESAQSGRELFIDINRRGLAIAPDLAGGDSALGFGKTIDKVFPGTGHFYPLRRRPHLLARAPDLVPPCRSCSGGHSSIFSPAKSEVKKIIIA
jgi:hypothetical protein